MIGLDLKSIPICIRYKIIKEYKRSEENSVNAISKRLNYTHSQVNVAINNYIAHRRKIFLDKIKN